MKNIDLMFDFIMKNYLFSSLEFPNVKIQISHNIIIDIFTIYL